jgi:hypothetical protein
MPSTTTRPQRKVDPASPPAWVKPQLAALVKEAPDGPDWLLWTDKYPAIAKAIAGLLAKNAYLDGELCGVYGSCCCSRGGD